MDYRMMQHPEMRQVLVQKWLDLDNQKTAEPLGEEGDSEGETSPWPVEGVWLAGVGGSFR